MASHGIRGTRLTSLRSNVENEAGNGPAAAKGRVTRVTRKAFGDIGNKATVPNTNKGDDLDLLEKVH